MRVLFFLCFVLSLGIAKPQTPQAMNYQAVARTATGAIIPAQTIQVRFSVLDVNVTGAILYQETQYSTTNNYGLFTMAIGKGTASLGSFAGINWASGTDKFLKVEIAPNGTNNYSLQGTTQLLSVPYALYSEKTRLIAGNAITITNGNTISANYLPGLGININGTTISHALKGGTGIRISNDSIYHNLLAGTGIAINGATISHNFVAGTGINITGNVISSTGGSGNSYWLPHSNGIYYSAGKVGIGMNPHPIVPLTIWQPNSNAGNAILHLRSNDIYHSCLSIFNGEIGSENEYSFLLAGPSNIYQLPGGFGLFNHQTSTFCFNANPTNNYMAIGSTTSFFSNTAKSRLHVFAGDINIDQIGSGIIMKSPNGNCWRITIDNSGNLVRTAIACP